LTESGCEFAQSAGPGPLETARALRPEWDGECSLRLGEDEVKHFRQPARAQKQILDAFQEEGWPPWIFNPLGAEGHRTGGERLRDAVNKLHALQVGPWRLHFRVERGGERVSWQILPARGSGGKAAPKRRSSGT
jgi:hypothetical protein